jgi:hypothetical protein
MASDREERNKVSGMPRGVDPYAGLSVIPGTS